jgi:hypothetical protein
LQPHWGAEAGGGSVVVQMQLPAGVHGAGTELCLRTVVDEDCVGRDGTGRDDLLWQGGLTCFNPMAGTRTIEAKLQAACWYVVAVAKQGGAVLATDLSWTRVASSDANSAKLISDAGISEEAGGRRALLEHAVRAMPEGLVLEFGGGVASTVALVELLDGPGRAHPLVHTFDWWKGLPRAWRSGFEKGHFSSNGRMPRAVKALVDAGKVAAVNGLVEGTVPDFVKSRSNVTTALGLVVFDLCLGDATRAVLSHIMPWMQPGTLLLFGSYANFGGWDDGGEHGAWVDEAAKAGLSFEYVSYYSTWMLVRVTKSNEPKQSASAMRTAAVAVAIATIVAALILMFPRRATSTTLTTTTKPQRLVVKKKKTAAAAAVTVTATTSAATTSTATGRVKPDMRLCWLAEKLEDFRVQHAEAADTAAHGKVREGLLVLGAKVQASIISALDEKGIDRKAVLKMQDEVGSMLAALVREPAVQVPEVSVGDALLCVVCLENAKCVLLLPCSHVCLCESCTPMVHSCPVCRKSISMTKRVFL